MPVTLTDAGFSTQLSEYVDDIIDGHPLWASRFLVENETACLKTHQAFVKAGAEIIKTNTYQASKEGFKKHYNLSEEEAKKLIIKSVNLCRQAIKDSQRNILIAGSIGPYGAYLNDGSEYTGSYINSIKTDELKNWHRWRLQILIDEGVDLIAFETLPCSIEALQLIELLKEFPNTKAWLSFSAKNSSQICNGENFAEVAAKCWESANKNQLIAIGINCTDPDYITPLFKSLKAINDDITFMAYPNSGEVYDGLTKKWIKIENKKLLHDYVEEWLDMGVRYVGGCCRNSAKDLQTVAEIANRWKHSQRL